MQLKSYSEIPGQPGFFEVVFEEKRIMSKQQILELKQRAAVAISLENQKITMLKDIK